MIDVDIHNLTEVDLIGRWSVNANTMVYSDVGFFGLQREIELLPSGVFKSMNGKLTIGTWQIIRQNEIIYNPQLKFFDHQNELGTAIITRLYHTIEEVKQTDKMNLYFNTGLEVVLTKLS